VPEQAVFQVSGGGTVGRLIACVACVIGCVVALVLGAPPKLEFAAVVGGPAFGVSAWFLAILLARRPSLVLTDEGITHAVYGHIAWSEIKYVEQRSRKHNRYMVLVLRDKRQYLQRASWLVRISSLGGVFGHPVQIHLNSLSVPRETVVEAIRHHACGGASLPMIGFRR